MPTSKHHKTRTNPFSKTARQPTNTAAIARKTAHFTTINRSEPAPSSTQMSENERL